MKERNKAEQGRRLQQRPSHFSIKWSHVNSPAMSLITIPHFLLREELDLSWSCCMLPDRRVEHPIVTHLFNGQHGLFWHSCKPLIAITVNRLYHYSYRILIWLGIGHKSLVPLLMMLFLVMLLLMMLASTNIMDLHLLSMGRMWNNIEMDFMCWKTCIKGLNMQSLQIRTATLHLHHPLPQCAISFIHIINTSQNMTISHVKSYWILNISCAVRFDEFLIVIAIFGRNVRWNFVGLNVRLNLAHLQHLRGCLAQHSRSEYMVVFVCTQTKEVVTGRFIKLTRAKGILMIHVRQRGLISFELFKHLQTVTSILMIECEHLSQNVLGKGTQIWREGNARFANHFEIGFHFKSLIACLAHQHLVVNNSQRPQITLFGIQIIDVCFRCHVFGGPNVIEHLGSIRHFLHLTIPKVDYCYSFAYLRLGLEQHIVRFQVAVYDPLTADLPVALQNLTEDKNSLLLRQATRSALHVFCQRTALQKFCDQIDIVFLDDNIEQADYVFMS